MNVVDAMVRKCKEVSIMLDKKMRKHRIGHNQYNILDDKFQTRLTNKRWKK